MEHACAKKTLSSVAKELFLPKLIRLIHSKVLNQILSQSNLMLMEPRNSFTRSSLTGQHPNTESSQSWWFGLFTLLSASGLHLKLRLSSKLHTLLEKVLTSKITLTDKMNILKVVNQLQSLQIWVTMTFRPTKNRQLSKSSTTILKIAKIAKMNGPSLPPSNPGLSTSKTMPNN